MIGQTVSHYRIRAELGRGGMGNVYLAQDTRLDRPVALKFLLPELARDREAVARFRNEAKAAAELSHPNIATIHDFDEVDGKPFLVFEYIEGRTLKDHIAGHPLPIDDVLHIGQSLTEGLVEAHAHGIVHRDLKSANVMLTAPGGVKILDFGLAHRCDATQLTRPGTTLGTVSYMSPEQARGEPADERSDIWSLGVVLYECLLGRLPFPGESPEAIIHGVLSETPDEPSGLRTGVPLELERILIKCLEKRPSDRYQHVDDLLVDLGKARRPSVPESKMRGKNRLRYAGFALVAVVLAMSAWQWILQDRAAPPDKDIALAVVDFQDVSQSEDLALSAGITGLVQVGLVEASPCRIISPQYLYDLRRRLFGSGRGPIEDDQALEVARRSGATILLSGQMVELGTDPYLTWQLVDTTSGKSLGARRVEGGSLTILADQIIADVLPVLDEACGMKDVSTPTPVSELTTTSPEAYEHYVAGLLALEAHAREDAVREFEQAVEADSTFALAYYQLSKIYHRMLSGVPQYTPTHEYAEKAWKYRSRLGIKDRLLLEAWRDQLNQHVPDALATYQELVTRWPDDKELLEELTYQLYYYWYFDAAAAVARDALVLYPDDDVLVGFCAGSLGHLGRSDEALEITRTYAEQHPEEVQAWLGVAYCYLDMASPDSAETACQRALRIDSSSRDAQLLLSYCDYYRGDLDRAIAKQESLLKQEDILPGQRIVYLTSNWFAPSLPLLYAEGGQIARALELYEEARRFAADSADEHVIELRCARLLLRLGRAETALQMARNVTTRSDLDGNVKRARTIEMRALVAMDSLAAAREAYGKRQWSKQTSGRAHLNIESMFRVKVALAENNPDEALVLLHEIDQRGMIRFPGIWYLEWRDDLACAHRMRGELEEAVRIHQETLAAFQGHFLSHYELGKLYDEMERLDAAAQQFETFLEKWTLADKGLPELQDAERRLKALRARP